MRNLLHCSYLLFIFLIFANQSFAQETGTLIVTYQTDNQGYRLDRIRFWLINDKQEKTLYPKKDEFVANSPLGKERTVVISHLPAGRYTIQFLTPNADRFFEPVPARQFELEAGEVVKIDQEIRPNQAVSKPQAIDLLTTNFPYHFPASLASLAYIAPPPLNQRSFFSLKSNLEEAEWKLFRNERPFFVGRGSIQHFPLIPGNYHLVAEEMPGYTVHTSPKGIIAIYPGQEATAEIFYQRDTGYIAIDVSLSMPLNFKIISQDSAQRTIEEKISPKEGRIRWKSDPLFTGSYTIIYHIPNSPPQTQLLTLTKGQLALLNPQFKFKGSIEIVTDSPEASFTLKGQNGAVIGQGHGLSYTFKDLSPGNYSVTFSAPHGSFYSAPANQSVQIENNQAQHIQVQYHKEGRIILSSNMEQFTALIEPLDGQKSPYQEKVTNRTKMLYLPTGKYRISFEAPQTAPLGPIEIDVKPFSTQNVYLASKSNKVNEAIPTAASKSGVAIISNLPQAGFTLYDLNQTAALPKHYEGKSVFIPLLESKEFKIVFDSIPNYTTPQSQVIAHDSGKLTQVEVTYQSGDSFGIVPAGTAIIGDPFKDNIQNERPAKHIYIAEFAIGVYEVTNAQFATWLNQAFKTKEVMWHPTLKGHLINQKGFLICRTMEGNPLAQIMTLQTVANPLFVSLPSKENYPVIEVSWYGAEAYCHTHHYRLPTEDEWEKAAGMALPRADGKLTRFKYGFGQDTIDRTWANYKDQPNGQVATTPIGFYNGIHALPLRAQDHKQLLTHNAKSPVGAYDMSGNVWEWVASGDDLHKIVKGGCYDSLSSGVRVSERLSLPANYADIYTGFRVAKESAFETP
jgi:formylglycine-generating enzyme required for sulfatase activity